MGCLTIVAILVLIVVGDVAGGLFSRSNTAKRLYRQRDDDSD